MLDIIERRAGIDWYTQTLVHQEGHYAEWRHRAFACLEELEREGYVVKTGGFMGYRGLMAGSCLVGTRADGTMVQFSGQHADRYFTAARLAEATTTRLDVQVTAKFEEMPVVLARVYYSPSPSAMGDISNGRKLKRTYIEGSDGGATLYIGAPSSLQRGRIYNKEVQSEDPKYEKCWRFEVTFKKELATAVAAKLAEHRHTRVTVCSQIVKEWFGRRGVECPWYDGEHSTLLPIIRSLPTDVEKRLRWLERQVKPAIRVLAEMGYANDAYTALGISTLDSLPVAD